MTITPEVDEVNQNNIEKYKEWVKSKQSVRVLSFPGIDLLTTPAPDTAEPPDFPHKTLFHEKAEEYAADMTSVPSEGFTVIAEGTYNAGLWAPCMVGKIEGLFLKMMAQLINAKRALDVGTFTGYSALALAEGVSADGEVVTLEADPKIADMARSNFSKVKEGHKITLLQGDALQSVKKMVEEGQKFDLVFLDADKVNYIRYYEYALEMLTPGGIILADNAMSSLVFAEDDPTRQFLHDFNQYVRRDKRVEQVMLTIREGVLMVRKI